MLTAPACWRWRAPDLTALAHLAADDDERWHRMMAWHEDRCAICGKLKLYALGLCVDHEHSTGRIRGLLCGSCNQLVEIQRAVQPHSGYRERPPAAIWGAQFEYWRPDVPPLPPATEAERERMRQVMQRVLCGGQSAEGAVAPYVPSPEHQLVRVGDGDEPREEVWQCTACPRRQTIIPDRLGDGAWITRIWHDRGNQGARHVPAVQDSLF